MSRWFRILIAWSGLLGLSGIIVGTAGAHENGGDLARLASLFLLIHASAIVGIALLADRLERGERLCLSCATMLAFGASFFSADLSALTFAGHRLFPGAAPIGGLLLIGGWFLLVVASLRMIFRDQPNR